MKDIGESFREKREEFGISKEEAANDMDITLAQLDNLEDGNANAFKDVFFLKELIKKYAKYLNISEDEIMSEYNEFMFNYTSRIPVAEIEKKVTEMQKEEKGTSKKVVSPYTRIKDEDKSKSKRMIYIIIIAFVIILMILIGFLVKNKIDNENFVGFNFLKGEIIYESSKQNNT